MQGKVVALLHCSSTPEGDPQWIDTARLDLVNVARPSQEDAIRLHVVPD
jgi:hypothetical protein